MAQQIEENKNILRFPYGVNFKHKGKLHHSLDRVWIVTKVPIPSMKEVPPFAVPISQGCGNDEIYNHKESTRNYLQKMCIFLKPRLLRIKRQHEELMKKLAYHLDTEMYTNFPHLKMQELDPTSRDARPKRGLITIATTLFTVASEVVSAFINYQKHKAINAALIEMEKRENEMENKVQKLAEHFTLFGKYDLQNTEAIIDTLEALVLNVTTLHGLIRDFTDTNDWTTRIGYNDAERRDTYRILMEEYTDQLELQYVDTYEKLLEYVLDNRRAINKMQKGYLPMELFPANRLQEIIKQVTDNILQYHPDHELAITDLNQYYDMKMITLQVSPQDHSLVITFPIFIKPQEVQILDLYEIEETFVPIQDMNQNLSSYTRIKINKPYIATAQDQYIQIRTTELTNCKHISFQIYCDEMFLIRSKNQDTCESALFYKPGKPELVKEECDIEFRLNQTVTPTILDGGNKIVLANFQQLKRLKCRNRRHNVKLPEGEYSIIDRDILCQCSILTGDTVILPSLDSCNLTHTNMTRTANKNILWFTINIPFYTYLKELGVQQKDIDSLTTNLTKTQQTFQISLTPLKGLSAQPKTLEALRKRTQQQEHFLEEIENLNKNTINRKNVTQLLNNVHSGIHSKEFMLFTIASSFLSTLITLMIIKLIITQAKFRTQLGGLVTYTLADTFKPTRALPTQNPNSNQNEVICADPLIQWIFTAITIVGIVVVLYTQCRHCTPLAGFRFNSQCSVYLVVHHRMRYLPIHLTSMPCPGVAISMSREDEEDQSGPYVELDRGSCWDTLRINYCDIMMFMNGSPFNLPQHVTIPLRDKIRARVLLGDTYNNPYLVIKQGKYWMEPRKYSPTQQNAEEDKARAKEMTPIHNMQ